MPWYWVWNFHLANAMLGYWVGYFNLANAMPRYWIWDSHLANFGNNLISFEEDDACLAEHLSLGGSFWSARPRHLQSWWGERGWGWLQGVDGWRLESREGVAYLWVGISQSQTSNRRDIRDLTFGFFGTLWYQPDHWVSRHPRPVVFPEGTIPPSLNILLRIGTIPILDLWITVICISELSSSAELDLFERKPKISQI